MSLHMRILNLLKQSYIAKQAKRPSGWIGTWVISPVLIKGNDRLNDFMLEVVPPGASDIILEVGFGPGEAIYKLAKTARRAKIYGVDFSADMVRKAKKRNAVFVGSGRVALTLGDISTLPYKSNTMDKIYTANTIYFWPDPVADAKELYRVLKPKGVLVIGFRTRAQMENLPITQTEFTLYSPEEVHSLLSCAGFKTISIENRPEEGVFDSFCAIAVK